MLMQKRHEEEGTHVDEEVQLGSIKLILVQRSTTAKFHLKLARPVKSQHNNLYKLQIVTVVSHLMIFLQNNLTFLKKTKCNFNSFMLQFNTYTQGRFFLQADYADAYGPHGHQGTPKLKVQVQPQYIWGEFKLDVFNVDSQAPSCVR